MTDVLSEISSLFERLKSVAMDDVIHLQVINRFEKDVEKVLQNYEKIQLQQKAKVVFAIKKQIDDWGKEYCVDEKCAGLLNCKLCLECEIGMRKGAYKDCLKLLDGQADKNYVCVPLEDYEAEVHIKRKTLERLKLDQATLNELEGSQLQYWEGWNKALEELLQLSTKDCPDVVDAEYERQHQKPR